MVNTMANVVSAQVLGYRKDNIRSGDFELRCPIVHNMLLTLLQLLLVQPP